MSEQEEVRVVRITAADYNPGLIGTAHNPWDGSPFSQVPKWLEEALKNQYVVPTVINGTDYAEWYVGEADERVLATAGDYIVKTLDDKIRAMTPEEYKNMYQVD